MSVHFETHHFASINESLLTSDQLFVFLCVCAFVRLCFLCFAFLRVGASVRLCVGASVRCFVIVYACVCALFFIRLFMRLCVRAFCFLFLFLCASVRLCVCASVRRCVVFSAFMHAFVHCFFYVYSWEAKEETQIYL